MKNKHYSKKIISAICAISTISMLSIPAFASTTRTSSQPYVESDTTVNFTLDQGKTYAYKMTVHGTHVNPKIAAGNGNILRTESVTHTTANGNDVYYFKVRAIGKQGDATGVYTTLPNQSPIRHSDIAIPYRPDEGGVAEYQVGKDIQEGQYCLSSENKDTVGAYSIKSDASQLSVDNCIDAHEFYGRNYATVKNGQYLTLINGASMIPAKDAGRILPQNGIYPEGEYKVGFDIPAGTYDLTKFNNSKYDYGFYFTRYNDNKLGISNVRSANSFHTSMKTTVKNGDYLLIEFATMTSDS